MRALITLSLIAACAGLGGCNSLHLYNHQADTTATAAKADYDASKIGERIKGQRAMLQELEEREVAAFRKLTLAERDQTLIALAASSELSPKGVKSSAPTAKDGFAVRFLNHVDQRLTDLDGDPDARADDQEKAFIARTLLSQAQQSQAKARQAMAIIDPGFNTIPKCNAAVAAMENAASAAPLAALVKPEHAPTATAFWPALKGYANSLGKACAGQLAAEKEIANVHAAPGFRLANAIAAHAAQQAASEAATDKAKDAKAAMKQAADELAAATKTLAANNTMRDFTCPEKDKAKALPAPAPGDAPDTKLCKALATLDKLGSIGNKIVAEEKIARIGRVLQAMSGVTPDTDDGKVDSSLALIAATTRLRHALQQYQGAGKWPALEPLIIEKQLAEAQLASANARVALDKARLGLHAEVVAALRLEVDLLNQARTTLFGGFGGRDAINKPQACTTDNVKLCASYEALLHSTAYENGVPAERQAYRAMALLAESYSTARDRHMTATVRLALSGYQQALIRSEESMASWKAVLDTPLDLLRQYHAGGIKPENLAALLQTLGIFSIAHRVK